MILNQTKNQENQNKKGGSFLTIHPPYGTPQQQQQQQQQKR